MSQITGKGADASSWPKGIYAITLFVEDLEAARQFYQKVFSLPVTFEDNNSAVFKFGNTLINLLKITEAEELIAPARVASREGGSRFVFTIGVDDVDAMCAELTARGVELLNGPMDRPWGCEPPASSTPAVISGRSQNRRQSNPLLDQPLTVWAPKSPTTRAIHR